MTSIGCRRGRIALLNAARAGNLNLSGAGFTALLHALDCNKGTAASSAARLGKTVVFDAPNVRVKAGPTDGRAERMIDAPV